MHSHVVDCDVFAFQLFQKHDISTLPVEAVDMELHGQYKVIQLYLKHLLKLLSQAGGSNKEPVVMPCGEKLPLGIEVLTPMAVSAVDFVLIIKS